jgi:hypothetical protein
MQMKLLCLAIGVFVMDYNFAAATEKHLGTVTPNSFKETPVETVRYLFISSSARNGWRSLIDNPSDVTTLFVKIQHAPVVTPKDHIGERVRTLVFLDKDKRIIAGGKYMIGNPAGFILGYVEEVQDGYTIRRNTDSSSELIFAVNLERLLDDVIARKAQNERRDVPR